MKHREFERDPILAGLWFRAAAGPGTALRRRLTEEFGAARRVLRALRDGLPLPGIPEEERARLADPAPFEAALRERDRAARHGIAVLVPDGEGYPEALQTLDDRPPVLYVRGSLPVREKRLAVVGTRRPTLAGRRVAARFARAFAEAGVTVTSGLALGIDTAAHEGALEGGGRTVAVLGSGLLQLYPPENRRLADRIAASGAVVSEFGLEEKSRAFYFPLRNRIVSGLGRGVLIVEAPRQSGALITASLALEQGRDVFAVPGSVASPQSAGSNALLRDGAPCVTEPEDVLAALGWTPAARRPANAPEPEDPAERRVLELLEPDAPLSAEALGAASGLGPRELLPVLSELESRGRVVQVAGNRFVRAADAA